MLSWVWAHDRPWDERTCASAASGGHLEVLKWAREHDCPWHVNIFICTLAAAGGHFEVLDWARAHGCPYEEEEDEIEEYSDEF